MYQGFSKEECALLGCPPLSYLVLVESGDRAEVFRTLGCCPLFGKLHGLLRERDFEGLNEDKLGELDLVFSGEVLVVVPRRKGVGIPWASVFSPAGLMLQLDDDVVHINQMVVGETDSSSIFASGETSVEEPLVVDPGNGYCYTNLFQDLSQAAEAVHRLGKNPALTDVVQQCEGKNLNESWLSVSGSVLGDGLLAHVSGFPVDGGVPYSEFVGLVDEGHSRLVAVGGTLPPPVENGAVRALTGISDHLASVIDRMTLNLDKGELFHEVLASFLYQDFEPGELEGVLATVDYDDPMLSQAARVGVRHRLGGSRAIQGWHGQPGEVKVWHAMARAAALFAGYVQLPAFVVTGREVIGEECGFGEVSVPAGGNIFVPSGCYVYVPRGTVVRGTWFSVDRVQAPMLIFTRCGVKLEMESVVSGREVRVVVLRWGPWLDILWSRSHLVPSMKSSPARLFRDKGASLVVLRSSVPVAGERLVLQGYDTPGHDMPEGISCEIGYINNRNSRLPLGADRVVEARGESSVYFGEFKFEPGTVFAIPGTVNAPLRIDSDASAKRELVNVYTISDEYTFDGGGPSGDDFSDGY